MSWLQEIPADSINALRLFYWLDLGGIYYEPEGSTLVKKKESRPLGNVSHRVIQLVLEREIPTDLRG